MWPYNSKGILGNNVFCWGRSEVHFQFRVSSEVWATDIMDVVGESRSWWRDGWPKIVALGAGMGGRRESLLVQEWVAEESRSWWRVGWPKRVALG
jgi:hypothetical protein